MSTPVACPDPIGKVPLWPLLPLALLGALAARALFGPFAPGVEEERAYAVAIFATTVGWWLYAVQAATRRAGFRSTVTVAALQQAAKVAGCGVFATLLCVLVVNALGLSRAGLVSAPSARAGERTAESLAVVFLLIGVLAPLAEEMLFRGALFRKWRLHWRPGKVAVAMSGVFALGHSNAPSVFLFALALTVLPTTTRTIWAPVTAHVLNNLLPLLAANTLHLVPADVLEAVVDWRWAPVAAVPALFATGWLIRFVSQGWGSLADPVDGVQLTPDPLPTVAELRQSIATTHSFEHTD